MKPLEEKLKLKDNEKVLRSFRHYFLILVPNVVISFLIILLDFFLMFYFFSLGYLGVGVFLVILFIAIFYVLRLLFLWNHNFVVVTSARLIDCERSGFFSKLTTEFDYQKVRSVTINANGLWHRLFRYGDLNLEIVGEPLGFIFYNLRRPAEVLALINEQINLENDQKEAVQEIRHNFDEIVYQVGQLSLTDKKRLKEILTADLSPDI